MLDLDPQRLTETQFGCKPEELAATAILSTHWLQDSYRELWDEPPVDTQGWFSVSTGLYKQSKLSVVVTHNGACRVGQAMLALIRGGVKRFLLIGRSSGLYPEMKLGDLALVRTSICGEGYSRYHGADHFLDDPLGWRVSIKEQLPPGLGTHLVELAIRLGIEVHSVRSFSSDSMLAQDRKLGEYVRIKGGHVIDGETSAAFAAARVYKVLAASVQCISALPIEDKPLFGVFDEDETRRLESTYARMPMVALESARVLESSA